MRVERCGYILETMTLSKLLSTIHIVCEDHRVILGISDNSKEVNKDWLFIAHQGIGCSGKTYIAEALEKGAVVLQEDIAVKQENVYYTPDIKAVLPEILKIYYQEPWQDLCMIGITGTNGKSSVANILKQLLEINGKEVMVIGTGQIQYLSKTVPISNTTPSLFVLLHYFSLAKQLGISTVIMEISSHAIDQLRIQSIFYDFIIYTNITQDHLDYHITKTHYQYTKFKLRTYLKTKGIIIINNDDPILESLYALSDHKIITCGVRQAHYSIRHIQLTAMGSNFELHTYSFHTLLLSMVNIYNITQAIMVCRCLQISYPKLIQDVANLHPVAGRLQYLSTVKPIIWIDYAHTFMAVKSIIDFANLVKEARLILVVGCGGEREKEKRKQIGEYVQKHCDMAIFTSDNPRHEDPDKIIMDMLPASHSHIEIIENRYFAIKHAIKIAGNSDIIVIAGKGNEVSQSFMGKEYAFHDEDCVHEILQREELF